MPSHHSSSSHSSHSSHSHSSHSSSHSSHSSHSYSSHSSSSSSGNRNYYSQRSRTNQPRGYSSSKYGQMKLYTLKEHDYVYYPQDWSDNDGKFYKGGYYDEDGNYYRNVVAPGVQTILTCNYCNTTKICKYKNDEILECPNCGAPFMIDKIDEKGERNAGNIQKDNLRLRFFFLIYPFLIGLFCLNVVCCNLSKYFDMNKNGITVRDEYYSSSRPETVYINEIGRTCSLDGEDYYDADSKCWFWFNDEVSPAQWQYWYDGISSKYGDYGWMEYDDSEKIWYIETSEGNWEILDESFNTENLWHFENANINSLY